MPAANPNSAPARGPPTMPAMIASSSMMSGPAPNTRRRSSTVSSTTRNSSRTSGTFARTLFMSGRVALRLPEQDLDEVEPGEVDEGVDRHILRQRAGLHLGRPHLAHRDAGREDAALQTAGDDDLVPRHLGADVDEVDGQRLACAIAARDTNVT